MSVSLRCHLLAGSPPPPLRHPRSSNFSFNQDHDCLVVAVDHGFRVYLCDPFRKLFRREFNGGGFGHTEMLFDSKILALVCGGSHPQYPPIKVMIWDDHYSSRSSSQLLDSLILACLGLHKGQIRLEHYSQKKTKFILAHDSRVACIALTLDATNDQGLPGAKMVNCC